MDYAHALFHYQNALNNYKKNVKSKLRTLIKTFTAFMIYLCFGSLVFFYIEQCAHVTPAPNTRPLEAGFLRICALLRSNGSTAGFMNKTFHEELKIICSETEGELTSYTCELSTEDFIRWFEYTITIAFTIGYGQVVCYSDAGKLVTIFYAIPAIAITIKVYACAGEILVTITKIIFLYIEVKIMKRTYVHLLEYKILVVQILLSLVLWGLLIISNIPLMDNNISALDVVYLTFITLTTIGFGDLSYTFSKSFQKPHVLILTLVFYMFGVGALASVLTELSQLGVKENIICDKCTTYEKTYKRKTLHRNYMATGKSPKHEKMSPEGIEMCDMFVSYNRFTEQETPLKRYTNYAIDTEDHEGENGAKTYLLTKQKTLRKNFKV